MSKELKIQISLIFAAGFLLGASIATYIVSAIGSSYFSSFCN